MPECSSRKDPMEGDLKSLPQSSMVDMLVFPDKSPPFRSDSIVAASELYRVSGPPAFGEKKLPARPPTMKRHVVRPMRNCGRDRPKAVGHVLAAEVGEQIVGLHKVATDDGPVVIAAVGVDPPYGITTLRLIASRSFALTPETAPSSST